MPRAEERKLTSLGLESLSLLIGPWTAFALSQVCLLSLRVPSREKALIPKASGKRYLLCICIQLVSLETTGIDALEPASDF